MDSEGVKAAIAAVVENLGGGIVLAFVAGEHQYADLREYEPLLSDCCRIVCDVSERQPERDLGQRTAQDVKGWVRYHTDAASMKRLMEGRKITVMLDFTGKLGTFACDWADRTYASGLLVQIANGVVSKGSATDPEHFKSAPISMEDLGFLDLGDGDDG